MSRRQSSAIDQIKLTRRECEAVSIFKSLYFENVEAKRNSGYVAILILASCALFVAQRSVGFSVDH